MVGLQGYIGLGIFALAYLAIVGGAAFMIVYWAARLAIRHERRRAA
jgi:hypothetical protein